MVTDICPLAIYQRFKFKSRQMLVSKVGCFLLALQFPPPYLKWPFQYTVNENFKIIDWGLGHKLHYWPLLFMVLWYILLPLKFNIYCLPCTEECRGHWLVVLPSKVWCIYGWQFLLQFLFESHSGHILVWDQWFLFGHSSFLHQLLTDCLDLSEH